MTDAQLAIAISAASATVALTSLFWTISWSIWQFRRLHRPRLTVIATKAMPVGPTGAGAWCVSVTVVNDGGMAVTLTSLKFVFRKDAKRQGLFPTFPYYAEPHALPIKLAPGERWTGLIPNRPVAAALIEQFGQRPTFKLWVVTSDAADREFRCKFSLSE